MFDDDDDDVGWMDAQTSTKKPSISLAARPTEPMPQEHGIRRDITKKCCTEHSFVCAYYNIPEPHSLESL